MMHVVQVMHLIPYYEQMGLRCQKIRKAIHSFENKGLYRDYSTKITEAVIEVGGEELINELLLERYSIVVDSRSESITMQFKRLSIKMQPVKNKLVIRVWKQDSKEISESM